MGIFQRLFGSSVKQNIKEMSTLQSVEKPRSTENSWIPRRNRKTGFIDGATSSEEDLIILTTYIADHRWKDLGVTRDVALPALYDFIKEIGNMYKLNSAKQIVNYYFQIQTNLMARKLGDLFSIQQHPAFSTQGQRILEILVSCYLNEGMQLVKEELNAIFNPSQEYKRPKEPIIVFEENKGDSVENAVIIHTPPYDEFILSPPYLTTNVLGVHSEYWYLCYKYGYAEKDWSSNMQVLQEIEGRYYDILTISTAGGERRRFYFDTTEFYGKD